MYNVIWPEKKAGLICLMAPIPEAVLLGSLSMLLCHVRFSSTRKSGDRFYWDSINEKRKCLGQSTQFLYRIDKQN